jgi:hypothetical protein
MQSLDLSVVILFRRYARWDRAFYFNALNFRTPQKVATESLAVTISIRKRCHRNERFAPERFPFNVGSSGHSCADSRWVPELNVRPPGRARYDVGSRRETRPNRSKALEFRYVIRCLEISPGDLLTNSGGIELTMQSWSPSF